MAQKNVSIDGYFFIMITLAAQLLFRLSIFGVNQVSCCFLEIYMKLSEREDNASHNKKENPISRVQADTFSHRELRQDKHSLQCSRNTHKSRQNFPGISTRSLRNYHACTSVERIVKTCNTINARMVHKPSRPRAHTQERLAALTPTEPRRELPLGHSSLK